MFSSGLITLIFTTTNSTYHYYWYEISNAVNMSLRSNIITPVLQPTSLSLSPCDNSTVISLYHNTPECAEVNSLMVIHHPSHPFISSCSSSSLVSGRSNHDHSAYLVTSQLTYSYSRSITLPLIHSYLSLMFASLTLNPFSSSPTHTLSTMNT